MILPLDDFSKVVKSTPLVSIDFLIENSEGKYLLGKRVNKPAKDYYFTLGGRILKDENIEDAMVRLSKKEFNMNVTKNKIKFHGVFEHFYNNSFMDNTISTHYIVLAYKVKIENDLELPIIEHSEYDYFTIDEIMNSTVVHDYVKDYFRKTTKFY